MQLYLEALRNKFFPYIGRQRWEIHVEKVMDWIKKRLISKLPEQNILNPFHTQCMTCGAHWAVPEIACVTCAVHVEANGLLAPPSPSHPAIQEDEDSAPKDTHGAADHRKSAPQEGATAAGVDQTDSSARREERKTDSPVPAIAVTQHDRVVSGTLIHCIVLTTAFASLQVHGLKTHLLSTTCSLTTHLTGIYWYLQ